MKKLFLLLSLVFLSVFFFLATPKKTYAQGTFDCQWRDVAGRTACRPVNQGCDNGYVADTQRCGQLTPQGEAVCESVENQNIECSASLASQDPRTGCSGNSINTAIGCIPVGDPGEFISFILRWAIGIAGGIAFLLTVVAGFQIITSQGDPQRLQAGKELLTSALTGLLLLIFGVFVLRIIGVNILGIF